MTNAKLRPSQGIKIDLTKKYIWDPSIAQEYVDECQNIATSFDASLEESRSYLEQSVINSQKTADDRYAVEQYRNEVEGFATEVEENRILAQTAANSASSYADDASTARVGAETAQGIAQGYETSARDAAHNANTKAAEAELKAMEAEVKAMEAEESAINAKASENLAKSYAESVNPDLFANVDLSNLSSTGEDKFANKDLSNINPRVRRVATSAIGSANWYIIYEIPQADGTSLYWCEQGARLSAVPSSFTFLIPFSNYLYTLNYVTNRSTYVVTAESTTSFSLAKTSSSVNDATYFKFYASGYCAKP